MPSPYVTLGTTGDRSIAASIFAIVDRSAALKPDLAAELRGVVRLRFREGYDAVRIAFGGDTIEVDDGAGEADLEIHGALPDVVALISAPLTAGVPKPTTPAGRAALARLADGRVRLVGPKALGRNVLRLLSVM